MIALKRPWQHHGCHGLGIRKVKIPRVGLCRMALSIWPWFRSYWSGIREFEKKYHDYLQMLSFFRNGPVESQWSGWKSSQNWARANPQVENEQLRQSSQSSDRIWCESVHLMFVYPPSTQPDPPYKVVLQFCSAGWERLTVRFMLYIAMLIIYIYSGDHFYIDIACIRNHMYIYIYVYTHVL